MTCSGGFLGGVCLGRTHFAYYDIVGVKTKRHIKKIILRYGLFLVLGFSCNGMNNLVDYPSVFITLNKVKLTGAVFNGVDSLIIGNCG